jgi:hypothetical protein
MICVRHYTRYCSRPFIRYDVTLDGALRAPLAGYYN